MNILPSIQMITTASAIAGYANKTLSQDNLYSISMYSSTGVSGITLSGTQYIGMEIQFPLPMPCSGVTIYTNDTVAGYLKIHTQDYNSGTWKWYTPSGIGGGKYSTPLTTISGLYLMRIFYGVASGTGIKGFYGVDVGADDYISISGSSAHINPSNALKSISITNLSPISSPARITPQYTNYFSIDKYSKFSKDYATVPDKANAVWEGFDNYFTVPEIHSWSLGVLSGLQESKKELLLMTSGISGTWVSPIIDTKTNPSYAYVYGAGKLSKYLSSTNNIVDIRCSDTVPATACFLISTTEPTHEALMYKHKRMHIDSKGNVVAKIECNAPTMDNKLWRNADSSFAGKPLHFCGSINQYGAASFLAPGIVACSVSDPVTIKENYNYWYRFCSSTFESNTNWANGVSVSGVDWGDTKYVIYTKTFPTSTTTWLAATIVADPAANNTSVFLACLDPDGSTRFSMPILSVNDYLSGSTYCSICTAPSINGWWMHIGGKTNKAYKMDFSGLDSILRWGISYQQPAKFYESYSQAYTVATGIRSLVEIPVQNYSGFWAICDNQIRLYKESNNLMPQLHSYNNSLINPTVFIDMYQGATDAVGNLWSVDITQQRVVRINLERSLRGDANAVDFDMTISGVIGVYAHPNDGTAYILITNEPAHPNVDVIRQVNSTQVPGSKLSFLCTVSGFCSSAYKYGTHFTGFCFTDYIRPCVTDAVWGPAGSLGWKEHLIGNTYLPYGRYKQVKVTLLRPTVNDSSPHFSAFRVPKPIKLNMGLAETKTIYYKLSPDKINLAGSFNINLDAIFTREE